MATLKIEGEITTSIEIEGEVPEGAPEDLELSQGFEFTFECEGTLLWDMEKGIAKELALGGDVSLELTSNQSYGGTDIVQTQLLEGEFSNSATFE